MGAEPTRKRASPTAMLVALLVVAVMTLVGIYYYHNRELPGPGLILPGGGSSAQKPPPGPDPLKITCVSEGQSTTVGVRVSEEFRDRLKGYTKVRIRIPELDMDVTATPPYSEQLHRKVFQGNRSVTFDQVTCEMLGTDASGKESVLFKR